jgi:hypothetical protein
MAGRQRIFECIVGLCILALAGGCTSGSTATQAAPAGSVMPPATAVAPTPSASTAAGAPITFEAFHGAFCRAWESMFRAVGNPDIGDGSELTKAMDEAIAAGDLPTVDRLAAEITSELEAGRHEVAIATGWAPAAPLMAQVDRVLVGFEAMTEAKRNAASNGLGPSAQQLGQEALEQSGAIDAWFALIRPGVLDETRRAIQSARPAGVPEQCPSVPTGI